MMDTFEPLVFNDGFGNIGPNGRKMKNIYFGFVSAAMFLLIGGPTLRFTGDELEGEAPETKLKEVNETITRHRRDSIMLRSRLVASSPKNTFVLLLCP